MSYRVIVLTEKEYDALESIIRNGWGDGDFKGWGNQNPRTQLSAMRHFDAAAALDANEDFSDPESPVENIGDLRKDQQTQVNYRYHRHEKEV